MSDNVYSINTAKVDELSGTTNDRAKKYLDKINEVTNTINELSADWGGPTYDQFKSDYQNHLASIEELGDILKEVARSLDNAAQDGNATIDRIQKIIG